MAEPCYRYQESRCYTLTITWLPAEKSDDLARDDETPPPAPLSRHRCARTGTTARAMS